MENLTRRQMILRSATAAAWLHAHENWGSLPAAMNFPATVPAGLQRSEPLIREIRLQTAVPLATMKDFYHQRIGFNVVEETASRIAFQTGASRLVFEPWQTPNPPADGGRIDAAGRGSGEPMYHFAFNIPENKIRAARDWQRQRTKLVPTPPQLIDPDYPSDVRHFANWNAHSVFFFDPAFNIVEYIARHELDNASATPERFGVEDILYASEIGFVVSEADREEFARKVGAQCNLHEYPLGSDPWAMGDEHGLLLVLGRLGELWGDNTETPVRWGTFPTQVTVRRPVGSESPFQGLPYEIESETDAVSD